MEAVIELFDTFSTDEKVFIYHKLTEFNAYHSEKQRLSFYHDSQTSYNESVINITNLYNALCTMQKILVLEYFKAYLNVLLYSKFSRDVTDAITISNDINELDRVTPFNLVKKTLKSKLPTSNTTSVSKIYIPKIKKTQYYTSHRNGKKFSVRCFSENEILILMESFNKNDNPLEPELNRLCKLLNISKRRIKLWFKNTRNKISVKEYQQLLQ